MDFIDWFIRTAENIYKHGLNIQTVVVSFMALYNVRVIRKLVRKRIPKRLRLDEDDRLERVEIAVRAIAEHLEVKGWVAEKLSLSASGKSLPTLLPVVSWYADIVEWFTQKTETFRMRGRMSNMSSKFKSRKFWLAIISAILVVLNEGLDLGISSETVITFAGIVLSFIFSEAYLDGKKLKAGGAYDYTGLDAERNSAEDTKAA
jgi:hypothetical protein